MLNRPHLLLISLVLIGIGEAIFTGLLPVSRGHLFTLLSSKTGALYTALIFYFLNYFSIDLFQSIKGYVVLKVALWYRELRTYDVAMRLGNNFGVPKPGIRIKGVEIQKEPTNCPQRIQEDIKLSYLCRTTVYVEYGISALILIQLMFMNRHEPILLALAACYAILSILIAMRFNPRLTSAEMNVQQAEANFRTKLVQRLTDIGGLEAANVASTRSKWIQTEYLLFTKLQLGLLAVLPYAILIPKLISGSMELGEIIQHQASFALLVVNAAVLIQLYPTLIQGKASETRVKDII